MARKAENLVETVGSKKIKSNQKPWLGGQLPTNVFVATFANRIKGVLNIVAEEAIHRGPIFSR